MVNIPEFVDELHAGRLKVHHLGLALAAGPRASSVADPGIRREAVADCVAGHLSLRRLRPLVFPEAYAGNAELARCFLRLANLPNYALDRLSRYECGFR